MEKTQVKLVCSLVLTGFAFLVVGCSTTSSEEAKPVQTLSYEPVSSAVDQKVVTRYIPIDVAGQLMPVPKINADAPSDLTGEAAVDAADKQATEVPNSSDFLDATMTYDYMPGEIYTIYAAPLKITDIALAPGEKLLSEAAGDTLRWQIATTYSGNVGDQTQHILIKPSAAGLSNTMVVTTDQHVYHLILQSTENTYMAEVQWTYPGNMVNTYQNQPPEVGDDVGNSSSGSVADLSSLDWNYVITMAKGWRPDWYPLRVFNDGKETYIEMPAGYPATQLPLPYIAASGSDSYTGIINWHYDPPYIILDSVLQKIRLQNATGKTIVEIDQTD